MKKKINFLKKKALELIQDESGQGTTEYILMLVAAVAVALVFKSQLGDKMKTHIGTLSGKIDGFINSLP